MPPKTVIFLGSKPVGYACFQYLLQHRQLLNVEVTGLLTRQRKEFSGPNDLAALAAAHDVPVLEDVSQIPDCDLLYSVQYHHILKPSQLAKARQIAVNLHMAPLPEYRGANQFSFALLEGKTEFGATIHQMDARIDHGDILFQKRFTIPENCWVEELYSLTERASISLFADTLKDVVNGHFTPLPQQQMEPQLGTALHFKNEMAALKEVQPGPDAKAFQRQLRATYMPGFEPPFVRMPDGEKIFLVREKDYLR